MAEGDITTDDDVWFANFQDMYLPAEGERIGEGEAPKPAALIHISIGTDKNYEKMVDAKLVKHLRRNSGDDQGWAAMLKCYHRLIWWHIIHHTGEEDHGLYRDIQYAVRDGLINRYSGSGSVLSYASTRTFHRVG